MPGTHKGFKMEPKGAYKKYKDNKGFNKYGLMDPNEVAQPIMKVTHLAGTEKEHVHKERPAHQNTPEAHGPMSKEIKMDRMMAKYKDPMPKYKDPMPKFEDVGMKKYKDTTKSEAMAKYDDLPKHGKARNGSLLRKDYMLQASAAEKAAAKAKAIDGGMPENVADKVFKKDLPTASDTVNAYIHHNYTNPYKVDKVYDKTYDSARKLKGYKPTKSEMERSLKNINKK
tara:strand:- start:365 stop:1045 length:681 start_codon:yes stop_codon:yes gene_type:complete